jgi:PAS domain S-box-containing protein
MKQDEHRESLVGLLRKISRLFSILALVIGALAAIGWFLDISYLKAVVAYHPQTMKLNTAFSFILLGAALIQLSKAQRSGDIPQKRPVLPIVCASVAAAISVLTLAEIIWAVNLGIDDFIVHDSESTSTHPPGRMSPITAVIIMLLSSAIWSFVLFRRRHGLWQSFTLISLFVSAALFLGHAFHAVSLAIFFPYATVALHTTIAFISLSLGLLFLSPDEGIMAVFTSQGYGGIVGRRILPASIVILILLGLLVRYIDEQGHLGTGFTIEFVVALGAVFISAIVWWTSKQLNRLDANQQHAFRLLQTREREAKSFAYQLQLLVEYAPSSVVMLDREMRYLWVSKRWLSDFVLTEGEITGRSHYEVFPEIPERWKEVHRRCLAGATEKSEEDRFKRSDGREYWLKWEVRPWRDETGQIGGIVIFVENITERKKAELDLRRANDELEARVEERTHEIELQGTIVRNMAEGVCLIKASDGRIAYANPKFEGTFGYGPGEINEQPVTILFRDDSSGLAQRTFAGIVSGVQQHAQYSCEAQNVRKDASHFLCRVTTSTFLHSKFGLVYVAVFEDITREKTIQETVARSEAKFRGLLESAPDSIVIVDKQGRIQQVNRQTEQLFGYERAELIGKSVEVLVPGPLRDTHGGQLETSIAAAGTRVQGLDLFARRKDSSEFPVDISLSPLETEEGPVITAAIRDVSERKRIESALRESEARHRDLTESSPDAILINKDEKYVFVNRSGIRLLGASSETDILGKSPWDLFHPDFHDLIKGRIRTILERHEVVETIPEKVIRLDGEVVDVEVTALPLQYKGEAAIMVILRDITERKRQAAKIETLAQSLDQANDAIIQRSLDDRITYWNSGAERMYGFTKCEALGQRSQDLLKTVFPTPLESIKAQAHWEGELRHTCKNGTTVTVLSRWTLRHDPAGRPLDNLEINTDITTRKQFEVALRTSEQEFRSLAEAMPQIVWATRADGWNIYFNKQWVEYTGMSLEESYGHGWNLPFHPDDRKRAWDAWQRATQEHATYALECRLRRFDGAYRWWLIRGVPLRDEEGKILKWFGTCTDIEDIKAGEAALRVARDELEQRVLERTTELQDTHKRVVELARESGMAEVATSVLHNVGNVLNSINTSVTVLKDIQQRSVAAMLRPTATLLQQHATDLPEFLTQDETGRRLPEFLDALAEDYAHEKGAVQEELKRLERNIGHVNTVVSVQQTYAGVSGIAEHVSVRNLIEDALQINAVTLEKSRIEVVREYQQNVQGAFDKHRVLQILVNLISNAKFALLASPRGDKKLTLRMSLRDHWVEIEVADNGIGIPEEIHNKIFQFGFTTRRTGHGFGLHSSAIAAQEVGGRLSFQSEGAGHGASFKLELPVLNEAQSTSNAPLVSTAAMQSKETR